jgi:uncharacterized protein YheU (UPF0270 family)
MPEKENAQASVVPYTSLQPATLRAVIDEFVTRDTTDYGDRERSLDEKVEDVMASSGGARQTWCSRRTRAR